MCGIWAIFGSDNDVCEICFAFQKIAHRGPDSFCIRNVIQFKNCCFGFHRLAIVDRLNGMQPMRLKCLPHLWLCYNGEIYNYQLLEEEFGFKYETECDGEAIVQLYNQGGIDFAAKHLDGVFAFILLDTEAMRVFVGRDTIGVRPAFRLLTRSGTLIVCSEGKGLMDFEPYENGSTTIVPVLPGHYEDYDLLPSGKVKLRDIVRFHNVGLKPQYKTTLTIDNEKDTHSIIIHLLKRAVKKRMIGQRRMGCMLSGGVDSSLIAALAVESAKELGLPYRLQTFTIGMADSPDIFAARKVATHLGTEHHEVEFTAGEATAILDDLIYYLETYDALTIRSAIGMYLLSKYIREKTDTVVIFSGEGADELMQGYAYFHKAPNAEKASEESLRIMKGLYMYDVLRAERSTSAHGLELRVPFLDHQFNHYFLSLPKEHRRPMNGREKYLIRSAFSTTGLIPKDVLWRPKEAFGDGVSPRKKLLSDIIQDFADKEIPDGKLEKISTLYPFNQPRTKKALLYRLIFEKHFPGCSKWIPYFWMPKWTDTKDNSVRIFKHYRTID